MSSCFPSLCGGSSAVGAVEDTTKPPPNFESKKSDSKQGQHGNGISVLDFIRGYDNLFDMTGASHGESSGTTEQGSRPTSDANNAKRTLGNQGVGENKKRRKGPKQSNPKQNENYKFEMEEWDPNEFFAFLESAGAEMNSLIIPTTGKYNRVKGGFDEIMTLTMKFQTVTSEATVDEKLHERFIRLSQVLSLLGHQNDEYYFGKKNRTKIVPEKLGGKVGSDNQVDLVFWRQHQANLLGLVPWENKVSWNFPGGTVTSPDADPFRLGRDVKLYELKPEVEVKSLADVKDTKNVKKRASKKDVSILNQTEAEEFGDLWQDLPIIEDKNNAAKSDQPHAKVNDASENGTYKMKTKVFPVRQLVAYQISLNARYGILSTGYRVDFVKLEVTEKGTEDEKLVARIAGPFWSVGKLNSTIFEELKDESLGEFEQDHYYHNIRKFGSPEQCLSIIPEEESSTESGKKWSTNIGDYSFMEGLLRFQFAATRLCEQEAEESEDENHEDASASAVLAGGTTTNSTQSTSKSPQPESYMPDNEMPGWVREYKGGGQKRQDGNNESYTKLCKFGGNFRFTDSHEKEKYTSDMKQKYGCTWLQQDEFWNEGGLTKFGPLTLSELETGTTESIGNGRIGQALATKLKTGNIKIAYKLLRQSEWTNNDDFFGRKEELKHEMKVYDKLSELQGTVIPRFLYAGSIVDASKWVIPEKGEIYAFATTYEGRSLSSIEALSNESVEKAVEGLQEIHKCGVLHADLELRNLVLDEKSKQIKFVDFGNAKTLEDFETQKDFDKECNREIQTLKNELSVLLPTDKSDENKDKEPNEKTSKKKPVQIYL